MKLKQLLYRLLKTPYKEKRTMVLWKRAYKKMLLARAKRLEHLYNINSSEVLLKGKQ